jgi:hypothetical protein
MVVHNAYGEQVGHQHNQMDFDLNIEAVVEGMIRILKLFKNNLRWVRTMIIIRSLR